MLKNSWQHLTRRIYSLNIVVLFAPAISLAKLPEGFSYCESVIPSLRIDLKYATADNFTGQPVSGYKEPVCILTTAALNQLVHVQNILSELGLGLKIFDGYRPQKAVNHFIAWESLPDQPDAQTRFYPTLTKKELFELAYIASLSGHSRGSTVDLTIIDLLSGQELNFGTEFDFFGEQAHPLYPHFQPEQRANRLLLRSLMVAHGFIPYVNEWWHFTLANEPFPATYFDFDIE